MSPSSLARKEPPGSFTMSDVFEIETINNGVLFSCVEYTSLRAHAFRGDLVISKRLTSFKFLSLEMQSKIKS
jgi:hypothetical protein